MRLNVPPVGALLFGMPRLFSMRTNAAGSKGKTDANFSRKLFHLKGSSVLAISRGDLTQWEGDAIVNAANERMLGGGGVDGAIHRAAGPELMRACYNVEEVEQGVRCPTGEARITPGCRLRAKHVIHTVGPIYENHEDSSPILRDAFKNSMLLSKENGLKSIAFPAISCGIYGYPQNEAATISIKTILEYSEGIDLIELVLFGKDTYEAFVAEALRELQRILEPASKGSDTANENSLTEVSTANDNKSPTDAAESDAMSGNKEIGSKPVAAVNPHLNVDEPFAGAEDRSYDSMDVADSQETIVNDAVHDVTGMYAESQSADKTGDGGRAQAECQSAESTSKNHAEDIFVSSASSRPQDTDTTVDEAGTVTEFHAKEPVSKDTLCDVSTRCSPPQEKQSEACPDVDGQATSVPVHAHDVRMGKEETNE